MIDVKAFYESKLKMTREEFARLVHVKISVVEQWEKAGEMPSTAIQKIAVETGLDFNTILGFKKESPKALIPKDHWQNADFTKKSLTQYISNALEKYDVPEKPKKDYIDGLRQCIDASLTKPRIAIVGRSDAGKSTLINALLGTEKMPTSWTPTTSIAVYIKHMDEKPPFIKENAWVFKNKCGGENLWDARRFRDEEYCLKWKIAAGDIDVLRNYGIHQAKEQTPTLEAGAAVVFIDAPILKDCDIIDIPGYGTTEESDSTIAFKATEGAEILIYLSTANAFMRIEDINYLKANIKGLPVFEQKDKNQIEPLSNLFIVASQANAVNNGNEDELKKILLTGCKNLKKTLPDGYWKSKEKISGYSESCYDNEVLLKRFFTYTTDIERLCNRFNGELKKILEFLPDAVNTGAKELAKDYISKRKPALQSEIKAYEDMIVKRDEYVRLLEEIDANEINRIEDNDRHKREALQKIKDLGTESVRDFRSYYAQTVNKDAIIKWIKEEEIENNQEEINRFVSRVQSQIQQQVEDILEEKTGELREITSDYISTFSDSVTYTEGSLTVDFDAGWEFMSAIRRFSIIGGLAVEIGGILTSIVFGVGALAAALGPIGIQIGLVVAAVMGLIQVFGGGWEQNVATNLVRAFEEKNVQDIYADAIKQYWEQVEQAFIAAARELDKKWDERVENLRRNLNEYDVDKINQNIQALNYINDFFDHIPL